MSHKGINASILVDEFNFDADTSRIEVLLGVGEAEGTNLASTAQEFVPLLPNMKINQNGYFDGVAAGEFEKELYDRLATDGVVVSALFGTDVTACPAYVIPDGFNALLDIQAPIANLMTLNGMWASTEKPRRGIRMFSGAISEIGNQDAIDLGSAGSAGGLFVLHVTSITGSASSASFKLQSCATEGGSYEDEATITVSAVDGYTAVMSGTVNRWVRLNCAGMGGATAFSVTAIAIVDNVTQ